MDSKYARAYTIGCGLVEPIKVTELILNERFGLVTVEQIEGAWPICKEKEKLWLWCRCPKQCLKSNIKLLGLMKYGHIGTEEQWQALVDYEMNVLNRQGKYLRAHFHFKGEKRGQHNKA